MKHSKDPLEDLESQDIVVAYEARDNEYHDILECIPDNYVDVDLGKSDRLKAAFMDHFKISKLPVVIIKGVPVLKNVKKKVSDHVDEIERVTLERINCIIDPCLVTVFIKGSPAKPKCGFTRSLIEILHGAGLTEDKIKHFDILSDDNIRKKLKEVNSWPTFPQVYIKGEFVGGLDIIKKMNERGKLNEKLSGIV